MKRTATVRGNRARPRPAIAAEDHLRRQDRPGRREPERPRAVDHGPGQAERRVPGGVGRGLADEHPANGDLAGARVPVDRFDDFVRQISRLGEVRTSHLGSQDVTEEFFDLEARIRNKQEEEKRLLKHLADSTGKLEDILKIETELTRVRGEVEQMQGRLRFLANRADLSTVTITATELADYTPPQPVDPARHQIQTTFFGSLNALIDIGQIPASVRVALVPWIPLISIGLFVAYRIHRASVEGRGETRRRHGDGCRARTDVGGGRRGCRAK